MHASEELLARVLAQFIDPAPEFLRFINPWPLFDDVEPAPNEWHRWRMPDVVCPDAPDGYGSTWGPMGDRYVGRPRVAKPGRSVSGEPRILETIVWADLDRPLADKWRNAQRRDPADLRDKGAVEWMGLSPLRTARFALTAGRLHAAVYALAELPADSRHSEPRACASVSVRWSALGPSPAGFACWVDGRFDSAGELGRRLGFSAVTEILRGSPPKSC